MLRKIAIWVSLLAATTILSFVLWSSPSFQECNADQQEAYYQIGKENPPKFPLVVNRAAIYVRCGGLLAHEYRDAATAIATVFIALFTFTLWWTTQRMMGATEASVRIAERALSDLERAYIFIEKIGGYFDPFVSIIEAGIPSYIVPAFSVSLINYGRTAGCIDIGVIRFEVLRQIPPEIKTAHITLETATEDPKGRGVEIIVGPDKTYIFERLGFENSFTQHHGDGIKAGTMDIYCHGFFAYRDIFNQSHDIKFCRKYVHRNQEWVPEGGRARNTYS